MQALTNTGILIQCLGYYEHLQRRITMKIIILAGGSGTRLHPMTLGVVKQLLPVYDKPMIYYPLSTAMLTGCREVLIISTPKDIHIFQDLFGDGRQLGCNFSYKVQPSPDGLAQAFILGEEFIGNDKAGLILGDNIFHGAGFTGLLKECADPYGGIIFARGVADPQRYGVVEFDENMKVLTIEEKPLVPKSSYAVPGLYFYDNSVIEIAKSLEPSKRGELEITDLNNVYLKFNKLNVKLLSRGFAYYDCGTPDALKRASNYIEAMQVDHNLLIGSPEEVAWRNKYINDEQLENLAQPLSKTSYGQYLLNLLK